MDLGLLLNNLIPSWNSVSITFSLRFQTLPFIHFLINFIFFFLGWYFLNLGCFRLLYQQHSFFTQQQLDQYCLGKLFLGLAYKMALVFIIAAMVSVSTFMYIQSIYIDFCICQSAFFFYIYIFFVSGFFCLFNLKIF